MSTCSGCGRFSCEVPRCPKLERHVAPQRIQGGARAQTSAACGAHDLERYLGRNVSRFVRPPCDALRDDRRTPRPPLPSRPTLTIKDALSGEFSNAAGPAFPGPCDGDGLWPARSRAGARCSEGRDVHQRHPVDRPAQLFLRRRRLSLVPRHRRGDRARVDVRMDEHVRP